MRVALVTRSTLFNTRGGDTVQVEQTAKHLGLLGVDAKIVLSHEILSPGKYDLLHFFNITRPADILKHILKTKIPFVVTPIWIDYSEYDKYHRSGIAGVMFRLLSPARIEYAKTVARWMKGKDVNPGFEYLQKGQVKSIAEILKKASLILPNSEAEYDAIKKYYPKLPPFVVVYNGIDEQLFTVNENIRREEDLVICVARIEGIKNQLNLIRALNHSAYRLLLIGDPAPNQRDYYQECRKIAAPNIHFIDYQSQESLREYYQRAKVHVLPSWFESCGLASLEAAAMGAVPVVTKNGFAAAYFEREAFYCDPGSTASIMAAVRDAIQKNSVDQLQQRIRSTFTWKQAALQTLAAYRKVLSVS